MKVKNLKAHLYTQVHISFILLMEVHILHLYTLLIHIKCCRYFTFSLYKEQNVSETYTNKLNFCMVFKFFHTIVVILWNNSDRNFLEILWQKLSKTTEI